jgi:protein involved in temperature-dependent protein secretion
VTNANLIEIIVKGERERAERWTDVKAASSIAASEPLPYLGVYVGTAVALLQNDKALIEGAIARDKAEIPSVAGTLTFRDGRTSEFKSIVDSDDGIGAMLETYGPDGLLYIPFAALKSVRFLPPRTFIDHLVAKAEVVLADGTETMVLVPLLYALSTTTNDASIRAGRMTTWNYVGSARRGLGMRDFVLNGGKMIGMANVAAIEISGASAPARPAAPAAARPVAPLPTAQTVSPATSSKNLLVIGMILLVIVVLLFVVMS